MPKRSTGYTPNKSKSNPLEKQAQPLKLASPKAGTQFPAQIKGPNNTVKLPKPGTNMNFKAGTISKPAKITPRTPKI